MKRNPFFNLEVAEFKIPVTDNDDFGGDIGVLISSVLGQYASDGMEHSAIIDFVNEGGFISATVKIERLK